MTSTSSFGSSKREGHDARGFYDRQLSSLKEDPTQTADEVQVIPVTATCEIFDSSSEDMKHLPDASIGLAFTSPPYHVGKDYDTDSPLSEFMEMIERVLLETYRVLEPGGRLVINLANLGRKPYVRLVSLVGSLAEELGFLPRGEIVWVKGAAVSGSCAWGTWRSAKGPALRDLHEYLVVFSRGRWSRVRDAQSTMTGPEFMELTNSVWHVRPASAKRVGHPAPFPVELAERVIQLFSYKDDVVLDPFMGSGSTAIAAENLGRTWVGYEKDATYCELAWQRIRDARVVRDARR